MRLPSSGRFDQNVVGEQYYQEALIKVAGPYIAGGRRVNRDADLYIQPDNPNDPNAIRVEIDGMTVGYIYREQAPYLRQQLRRIGVYPGDRVTVAAVVAGGKPGTRYGVYLDFDLPEEAIAPAPPPPPQASSAIPESRPSPFIDLPPKKQGLGCLVPWWVYVLLIAGILLALRGW